MRSHTDRRTRRWDIWLTVKGERNLDRLYTRQTVSIHPLLPVKGERNLDRLQTWVIIFAGPGIGKKKER